MPRTTEQQQRPDPIAVPVEAQASSEGLAKSLLAGKDTASAVAWVVLDNPRHENALLDYVMVTYGNDFTNQTVTLMSTFAAERAKNGAAPGDNTRGVRGRFALSGADGGTAAGGVAPTPTLRLPFDADGGWDATAINAMLGQRDDIAGTDSDAARCGFATALAGQIFQGPATTAAWLIGYLNHFAAAKPSARQLAARDTVVAVAKAIGAGTATYGDLSWAQEALHAYRIVTESGGTAHSKDVVVPELETFRSLGDRVVTSPQAVLDEATSLEEGERLMMVLQVKPVATTADAAAAPAPDDFVHQIMITRHDDQLWLYDANETLHAREATEGHLRRYFQVAGAKASATLQGRVKNKQPPA